MADRTKEELNIIRIAKMLAAGDIDGGTVVAMRMALDDYEKSIDDEELEEIELLEIEE